VWVTVTSLAAWGFTTFVGLRPRPLVLAGVVLGTFAVAWVVSDVAGRVSRIDWDPPRRRVTARLGLDPRFLRMSALMRNESDRRLVSFRVHRDLVRVIDDRLVAHHGVDRTAQPDEARHVLGPMLSAYVETQPHARQLHPRYLQDLLTRIEAL
jgi:hypothetical protein